MPASNPCPSRAKPQASTRVGNGKAILSGADARSMIHRRYREILASLCADIGGDPTEAQQQIARRAASLAVWCEQRDAEATNGKPFDIGMYTTASNSLRRLLADLGIERRARNVTPSLRDYVASKAVSA